MPATSPQVSVVLPVFNAAKTLARALDSIRQQSLTDWELLAADDGSTDESPAMLQAAAAHDARIRVLRQPHAGLVPALQLALANARGAFIARMDADDLSAPERLARQAHFLHANPAIGLVSCRVAFGGDGIASRGYAQHVDWLNSLLAPADIALNRFVESPLAHPSVMFRRELLAQYGSYREGPFPEDYELWLRWLEAGVQMAKVPEVLLTWNDPPARLSRSHPRYAAAAFYAIKAGYLARAIAPMSRGRAIWIWGAGRLTRRRAGQLTQHGVAIAGFIDIDPRKVGRVVDGRPTVGLEQIPDRQEAVVLGYVAKRGARDLIRAKLSEKGYCEGHDFWMAA